MAGGNAHGVFVSLNRALDELSLLAEESVRFVHPHPILLVQPPSNRDHLSLTLSETFQRIESLAEACHSVRQRLTCVLSVLERCEQNCQLALAPVSCLPTEILCRIFEFAILSRHPPSSSLSSSSPAVSALLLSQVCSAWRTTARAYKPIWAQISMSTLTPSKTLKQHIKLSAGRPLHLVVSDELPHLALQDEHRSDTWLHTIEDLSWDSNRNLFDSLESLGSTMTAHKTLTISKPDCPLCGDASNVAALLNYVVFPQLRTLSLESIYLGGFDAVYAPLLNSLVLSHVTVNMRYLDWMLGMLGNLKVLRLEGLNDILPHDEEINMAFSFPLLRSLITSDLDTGTLRHIMIPTRYPTLRH